MTARCNRISFDSPTDSGLLAHIATVISLRPGLDLILSDYHAAQREVFFFEAPEDVCDFVFFLSGKVSSWIDGFTSGIEVPPLSTTIWLTPRLASSSVFSPGPNIRFASIRLQRSFMSDIAGNFLLGAPEEFRLILEDRRESLYHRSAPMTLPMQEAARLLFHCPYHTDLKKLFFESKALELVAQLLAFHFGESSDNGARLLPHNRKKISLARDYLLAQMDVPPSLEELARYAGLSETSLKSGFRKMYGDSVFSYLRTHRLERARLLLKSGEMNVTEAASTVGFSSLSHFSHIFKATFGVNPGIYSKEHRY